MGSDIRTAWDGEQRGVDQKLGADGQLLAVEQVLFLDPDLL